MAEEKVAPSIVPFSEFLKTHRRGALDDEITAALADCARGTAAVGNPKKPGKVLITLTFEANGLEEPTIMVIDQIKVTVPEHDRPSSIYYLDINGGLSRTDPLTQLRMPKGADNE
jgi:hypothetical protein